MNVSRILANRNIIYGFCALWILFFHVYSWTGTTISVFTNFVSCGNCGVDVFLLLSGMSLSNSFNKRGTIDYKDYIKRRAIRVLIPYMIVSTPYLVWKHTVELPHENLIRTVMHILADFSSATFWLHGVQTTWFVFAIMLFYLVFPFIYKKMGCSLKELGLVIFFIVLGSVFFSFIPVVQYSAIVWSRLPIFIIGTYIGKYWQENSAGKQMQKTEYVICWVGIISLCVFFSVRNALSGSHIALWVLYGVIAIGFLICLDSLFKLKEIFWELRRSYGFPMYFYIMLEDFRLNYT